MSSSPKLGLATLLQCFIRTYLVGAAFNTRGMQNVGLVFILEPGLRAVYPSHKALRRARKRYLKHYNCHFFWTPALAGIFLSLEKDIAAGRFPEQMLRNVTNTTVYTLSAIGDSVFGGSLLTFWSLVASCLLAADRPDWALAWGIGWFVVLQCFKLWTFVAGLKNGLKMLKQLKRWDLINWGRRLKMVNALVMTAFLYLAWPGQFQPWQWAMAAAALASAAWLVSRTLVSREIVVALLLGAYAAFPWLQSAWSAIAGG